MMKDSLFNPLEHPVCLDFPLLLEETAWAEHIPFAMFLTSALRPRIFIELGTFRGVSYCAFCQAVKSLQIDASCYAIDTWQGDEHAGFLENGVLTKLKKHHDALYAEFSRLVQSTFDEAVSHFAANSVDLLHIDGFHTYEAVAHDFETWLPKMSERGVVLFHDTNVRERGFGVWKLWKELSEKYPHFEFLHGHGLGVLSVGRELKQDLQEIFDADATKTNVIRQFFHKVGSQIEVVRNFNEQSKLVEALRDYQNKVNEPLTTRFYQTLKAEGFSRVFKKSVK